MNDMQPRAPSKTLVIVLLCIVTSVCIAITTTMLLLAHYPTARIVQSDLVEAHSNFSSIKIPRQWQQFPAEKGVAFGNLLRDGSSSATITMLDNGFFQTNLVDASVADMQDAMTNASKLSELDVTKSACTDEKNLIAKSDFVKFNTDTRELIHKRAECSTPSKKRIINDLRIAVGRDGRMRGVIFTARMDDWQENQKVYQIMLDSLSQRER